jgi:hypothetical protein
LISIILLLFKAGVNCFRIRFIARIDAHLPLYRHKIIAHRSVLRRGAVPLILFPRIKQNIFHTNISQNKINGALPPPRSGGSCIV